MKMKEYCSSRYWFFVLVFVLFRYCFSSSGAFDVSYDERALTIDGVRRIIISGSIHYPRSTPEMWPSLIRKAKEGGVNAIETYVFWNAHEPLYRQYDFTGNLDLIKFLRTIQGEGLYALLRIGPYVCAEWNNGGFPGWLNNMPNMEFRTNNTAFKHEMANFTTMIIEMVKHEGLFASQGGPIILAQLENEYGNVKGSYPRANANAYVDWVTNLAQSYKLGIPWIMCMTGDYTPKGVIPTYNGFYADTHGEPAGFPKFWTENWVGWFKNWGERYPHRAAEDVAFAVARFFQAGGTLQNYYMYHGGTNFGRTSGGPYIATTYDYDAPLDEYGKVHTCHNSSSASVTELRVTELDSEFTAQHQSVTELGGSSDGNLNQPKWGHLKELHQHLRSYEDLLTLGKSSVLVQHGWQMQVTEYSYQGRRFCFFGNADDKKEASFELDGTNFTIAPWSVSIRENCYKEVYNTAKVNTQTSVMVKRPNWADRNLEPYNLVWGWRPEKPEHLMKFNKHIDDEDESKEGSDTEEDELEKETDRKKPKKDRKKKQQQEKVYFESNQLFDQKFISNDTSDYVWYMTRVDIDGKDTAWRNHVTLKVHSAGHVLHVFVNGKPAGTRWGTPDHLSFDYETKIRLKKGSNSISLLSVTVGLPNYGGHFERVHHGIIGPVQLLGGDNKVLKDLQNNTWSYKVGLNGIDKELYRMDDRYNRKWKTDNLPTSREFVWYQTTFKAPLGEDPVVLDLLGLGKGIVWVNGHNLGRYWPRYYANPDGCDFTCNYRGTYGPNRCETGCGESSQRWYHVPRDYLQDDDNWLVLFEEFGGDPNNVKVQTVTVGTACGNADEGHTLDLSCQGGRVISEIKFASFGDPKGTCGSFRKGQCESPDSKAVVQKKCLGRQSCSIAASEWSFQPSGCRVFTKRLAIEAICS